MSVFNIISLLGGLAMFLYGMRLMGDSLKEGSSGALKKAMEKVTNNAIKAFFLGLLVTAIIQSSTATIVITSGLVAAGVISLHQSLGIIIGANVGTTVTGQIIRLLDVDSSATSFLQVFKPSTLAPIALIIGIILIMGFTKEKKASNIGSICIGFGILFSGLLNMTSAVSVLSEGGYLDSIFSTIGDNMWLGYAVGAGIAFVLQSSSATIGILQAFAMASVVPFKAVYMILVGIYLGDCVTTAIVCSIGAKADSKRVGLVNILFNLSETVLVLAVVNILHACGLLDGLWDTAMTSGTIANTNTIFNLGCAILLLPVVGVYEKLACRLIKNDTVKTSRFSGQVQALNPLFAQTPAIAFKACYDVLLTMYDLAVGSINKAIGCFKNYDQKAIKQIMEDEEDIDYLTDKVGSYLVEISPYVKDEQHIRILNQYNRLVNEFERLGDHATNLAEIAVEMHNSGLNFSDEALKEIAVVNALLDQIFQYTRLAFEKRDVEAARQIEPLEDVMDDLTNSMHDNHINRLREGLCTISGGMAFLDIITNVERISDLCSNVGISVVARVNPELAALAHTYVASLHDGNGEEFKDKYQEAHDKYFGMLELAVLPEKAE